MDRVGFAALSEQGEAWPDRAANSVAKVTYLTHRALHDLLKQRPRVCFGHFDRISAGARV